MDKDLHTTSPTHDDGPTRLDALFSATRHLARAHRQSGEAAVDVDAYLHDHVLGAIGQATASDTQSRADLSRDTKARTAALTAAAELALDISAPRSFHAARAQIAAQSDTTDPAPLLHILDSLWAEGLGLLDTQAPPDAAPYRATAGRVAYVSYSTFPYHSTGYANRTHALARGLRKAGLDVHVIARPGYPWDEPAEALNCAMPEVEDGNITLTDDGVPYHFVASEGFLRWENHAAYVRASTKALIATFRTLAPEVVIGASNHAAAVPAFLAARALGIPFINEVRGFWEESRVSRDAGFAQTSQYLFERALDTQLAVASDLVATIGPAMGEELRSRGVMPERLINVPNGAFETGEFDTQAPTGDTEMAAHDLPFAADLPLIGYVGSFARYEGLELLIDACGALHRAGVAFGLVLVGDARGGGVRDHDYRAELIARAHAAGIAPDMLHAPGRVAPDVAQAVVAKLDIAVFARVRERVTDLVTPLKPAEAMMLGRCIVASDVGGFDGVLRDGDTAVRVPAGDVSALHTALAALSGDPKERARLGQAARADAQRRFDWDAICTAYAGSIRHVAAQGMRQQDDRRQDEGQQGTQQPAAAPSDARVLAALTTRLDALAAALDESRAEADAAQHALTEMRKSTSWRLTAPLRGFRKILTTKGK